MFRSGSVLFFLYSTQISRMSRVGFLGVVGVLGAVPAAAVLLAIRVPPDPWAGTAIMAGDAVVRADFVLSEVVFAARR